MPRICVLGSGGWGTALAVMLAQNGHTAALWARSPERAEEIGRDRENKRLLPGVMIPPEVELTCDLSRVKEADFVVLAVPSDAVRQMAHALRPFVRPETVVVNVAKGFEESTLKRLSQVIEEELPGSPVAVLSGPSHAEEVSRGAPTTVVASSRVKEAALAVQDAFMNPRFRIYANPDIVGVELGGALKNVIALAAGICDGLALGDNPKAALMTRGITEMARLGVSLGGSAQTFAGLTGIGDLIVTCTSVHSRNRRAGVLIGQGLTARQAIEKVGMTVEGYRATAAAHRLAGRQGIEMPIVTECYHVLYEDKNPKAAIHDLMGREKKHEVESTWVKAVDWD